MKKLANTGGLYADCYFLPQPLIILTGRCCHLERPYSSQISLDGFCLWRYPTSSFHWCMLFHVVLQENSLTGLTRERLYVCHFFWSIGALMHAVWYCHCRGVKGTPGFVGFETAKENLKTVTDISKVINTSVAFFCVPYCIGYWRIG